jgi:N-acetylglutamate synthase-like GNAT family acetyltransferase
MNNVLQREKTSVASTVSQMKHDIVIRLALVSEQKELEALQFRASIHNAGDREAILANPDAIHLPLEQITKGQVFVAEMDGLVRGFAAILPRQNGDVELDALFVEPSVWRFGCGRKLIDHCARTAQDRGSAAIHVIGNPHAEGFYKACGFEALGTTQTRFGNGLLMRMPLSVA